MNHRITMALLGSSALLYAFLAARPDQTRERPTPSPRDAARGQADGSDPRVDALRRDVAGLAAKVRTFAAEGLGAAQQGVAATPASASEAAPPPSDAERKRQLEARVALLDNLLATERDDPAWTGAAVNRLKQAYSGPEFAGAMLDVACGMTLCRSDFKFDPDGEFQNQGARMLHVLAPWSGQGFMKLDREAGRVTFYLAREDTRLPRPAQDGRAERAPEGT